MIKMVTKQNQTAPSVTTRKKPRPYDYECPTITSFQKEVARTVNKLDFMKWEWTLTLNGDDILKMKFVLEELRKMMKRWYSSLLHCVWAEKE